MSEDPNTGSNFDFGKKKRKKKSTKDEKN